MLRFINIYFCVHCFFQHLVLFVLFFFIGSTFGSTYSPDGGFPPDDGGPCECKNGEMVCPATTSKPILLMRGSVKESVTDISISGPLGGWRHV
ncbi:MAG: hypothetical protein LBG58_11110, partial [Planctomycetaceae bacterium]|nr:hypothetical protein [Planctomycetaceae bacterium]